MQANGDVVLFIEEQLQLACDTGKSTWLDRMEQLGSYKALRDKVLKAYNGIDSKADKALKVKYYDDAKLIYDSWDDMQSHIKHTHDFVEKNGLDKMSDKQSKAWIEEHASEQDTQQYLYEIQVIDSLIGYKYEDNTLLDFMAKDKKEFEGENIKYLYPLVACLSKGQKAGLDSFTGMFAMTKNAMAATVLNDYKTGKATELADLDKDDKKFLEDSLEVYEEVCDNANESTPVSVYTGVDRELFKDGVAVTTTAQTFSNGSSTNWTDAFVESDKLLITSATMGALSIASLSLSVVGACVIRSTTSAMRVSEFNSLISATSVAQVQNKGLVFIEEASQLTEMQTVFEQLGANQFLKSKDLYTDVINASKEAMITPTGIKLEERAVEIRNVVNKNAATAAQKAHPFYNAMKIGFAIAAIILCAADIALTVYTLYKYYNREHLDIPKYMVDISYDEDKETSYVNYKMLKTQDGGDGDLNAGIGKQWLAIYQTKDEDVGNPIIVSDDKPIVVQYGKSKAPEGYSPLHLFGVLSSAQNLTFEDGESGWSYNDKKGGTYLFFNRSDFPKSGNQEGTVIDYEANKTTVGIVTALIGLVIGAGGMLIVSKKKKRNE